MPVPGTGTSTAPVELSAENDADAELPAFQSPLPSTPPPSSATCVESTGSSPCTQTVNLGSCRSKGTTLKPRKRPRVERDLMAAIDKLSDSSAEIEKLRIEASLTMHQENLVDRQENRKLEFELFQLQQASGERMAALFADVVKKNSQ